ncbi:MAG: hypothetical protein DME26_00335 [Verrucomicrobia bacterium]|nr:MAG: hypothetical protein DME26_00335 [Verrucomicrobiota bacterium]
MDLRSFTDWFLRGDYPAAPLDVYAMVLGLLLAFLGGQLVAWVYILTHSGLSYSRSFVVSLLVLPIVVALVMFVLSNNLVTAFGLMAVFAIVRFRNILRDTLDTTYVLTAIVIGMASGTQKFTTAVIGTLLMAAILIYLWYTSFGTRHRYDVILNLHWGRPVGEMAALQRLLERHGRKVQCTSQRSSEGYGGADLSYRLLLRDPGRIDDMLGELRNLEGVSRVTSMKAEEESEV